MSTVDGWPVGAAWGGGWSNLRGLKAPDRWASFTRKNFNFSGQKTHLGGPNLKGRPIGTRPETRYSWMPIFLAIRGRPEKRKYSRECRSNMGNPGIKSVSG